MRPLTWLLLGVLLALVSSLAFARDPAVIREFRKHNPCPSTGKTTGPCPTHVVDHGLSICLIGATRADVQHNLFWQEKAASYKKDKEEREVCREVARLRKRLAELEAAR